MYRARDKRLGRDVAVKVLGADVAQDHDRCFRFDKEARAVAALNHPNIVSLFDIGTEGEILYTVSELVEGESLRALLQRGPVPVRRIVEIAVQMADGMAAAHSAGITHRDLKPENVMVTREERVKILDFGLARQSGRAAVGAAAAAAGEQSAPEQGTMTAHSTQPGIVMGTVSYMSPEQARGLPVGHQSDQFSFGLILYELATGRRAFQGESTPHTLAAIISEEPRPIEVKLPPPLSWAIDRCLTKEPTQRYESTRDLYHDLRALRDHYSEAYSGAATEAAGPAKKAGGWWKWVAIPASVLLVAAIALMVTRDAGQDISRYRYTPFAMSPEGQFGPHWSPDGKAVAYAGVVNGHAQVFVRYLDSPAAVQLTTNPDHAKPRRWSPDSKRIFLIAPAPDSTEAKPRDSVYSMAVVGAEPEHVAEIPNGTLSADISPDNQTIAAFGNPDGKRFGVYTSSPPGSAFQRYQPAPFESQAIASISRIRFSPDGKKLLLTRTGDSNDEEAWLLSYPPGESVPHRVFTQFPRRSLAGDFSWFPDSRHVALPRSTSADQGHVWIADTQSDYAYQVTSGVNWQLNAAVSPDGRQIVYSEDRADLDIVTVSLLDGKSRKFIATDVAEQMPEWSARSEKLVYVTSRNGAMEIWLRSADGSDRPLVTSKDFPGNSTHWLWAPSLSPDGTQVVFVRTADDGSMHTWIKSLLGGSPQRLNESESDLELTGTWSPDGRRFAELSPVGSNERLLLVKIGSREKPIILRERLGDFVPDWSPSGEWLTFLDESGWNMISPDGKTLRPLGKIPSAYLAFSKDGKFLYGIREQHEKATLFSLDVATLRTTDIRELGKDLAPRSDPGPSIRLSLTPDGKSITYATASSKSNLWLLEGFRQPGLLPRLGLDWP